MLVLSVEEGGVSWKEGYFKDSGKYWMDREERGEMERYLRSSWHRRFLVLVHVVDSPS